MSIEIKEETRVESVVSSIFYAEYPTPEECRQLLGEVERKKLKTKKLKSPKELRFKKRVLKQTTESLERSRENQRRKERMCLPASLNEKTESHVRFQKNTFVLRFVDIENEDFDVVWCVDNHQLLSKYVRVIDGNEPAGKRVVYSKTERYTGWLCDEFWTVFSLNGRVESIDNGKRIAVNLPTAEEMENTRIELLKRRELESAVGPEFEMPLEDEKPEKTTENLDNLTTVKIEIEEQLEDGEIVD